MDRIVKYIVYHYYKRTYKGYAHPVVFQVKEMRKQINEYILTVKILRAHGKEVNSPYKGILSSERHDCKTVELKIEDALATLL